MVFDIGLDICVPAVVLKGLIFCGWQLGKDFCDPPCRIYWDNEKGKFHGQ